MRSNANKYPNWIIFYGEKGNRNSVSSEQSGANGARPRTPILLEREFIFGLCSENKMHPSIIVGAKIQSLINLKK
jgi:hypothetical protein